MKSDVNINALISCKMVKHDYEQHDSGYDSTRGEE